MGQKLKQFNTCRIIGISSLGILMLLAAALIYPGIGCNVNAADGSFSTNASATATAHIPSVLSVSLSSSADMTIAPSWTGSFTSSQTTLSITTNNPTGYQIFLETADGTQNLNPVDTSNTQKIAPIIGTASKNNFASNINTWGYALLHGNTSDDTEYSAIPLVGSNAVENTNTTTSGTNYNLSFAAIVSAHLPVDTYTNQVIVTVVANPTAAKVNTLNTKPDVMEDNVVEGVENE